MLCTYISDIYNVDDAKSVAKAIDDIAAATDNDGWASNAVYCFWDPKSLEILYIGLATDIYNRFRQHNGLIKCEENCCKVKEITKWFASNKDLGISLLLQSSCVQGRVSRNKGMPIVSSSMSRFSDVADIFDGKETIKMTEGLLIETHRLVFGKIPPWNKQSGDTYGQKKADIKGSSYIQRFTGELKDEFVSSKTIRQISQNPTWLTFEMFLHGVRLQMALHNIDFERALDSLPDLGRNKEDMQSEGYCIYTRGI